MSGVEGDEEYGTSALQYVEQQIRPWEVLDTQGSGLAEQDQARAIRAVASREMAFMDIEIPLGYGVSMWQPKMEARALQALKLKHTDQYWKSAAAAAI
ncbi:MAG: hypothetical protein WDM70_05565 [Nitrosomonadales bacterium]